MALVTYKGLCIDALDVPAAAEFWSRVIGLRTEPLEDGEAVLVGVEDAQSIWLNLVPEATSVKHRVHLDVTASSLEPFAGLDRLSIEGQFPWTVLADPEGGQLCVFTTADVPAYRLKDIVVDAADPVAAGSWWADVWGGTVVHDDSGYSYFDDVPGAPFGVNFVSVPEPKTVKNRIHWDVTLNAGVTIDDLVGRGATLVRAQDGQIRWTVMADPEGNEFCAFDRTS